MPLPTNCLPICLIVSVWAISPSIAQKPYRLPDLGERFKDRIIWGSQAESPDGFALAFGGQDQVSDDGIGHTRIKRKDGEWTALDLSDHPFSKPTGDLDDLVRQFAFMRAILRSAYFDGADADTQRQFLQWCDDELDHLLLRKLPDIFNAAKRRALRGTYKQRYEAAHRIRAAIVLEVVAKGPKAREIKPKLLRQLADVQIRLEQAADLLRAEPPPRGLSPLVYEPKSGLFVLFGGDHFDYLMNDVWVFDPNVKEWSVQTPAKAPRPRANHTLKARGDGKIVLTGGYTYTSNTDYLGGQYIDLDDGEWVYDLDKNAWSGDGPLVAAGQRTYRKGPFHPDFYLDPKPDRDAHEKVLAELPPNQWVKMNPPKLPRLNRDWGTAVLDPDRDLILRWSGGHSAHGGTDVLHYHLATNRWELCYPVEFPLGQLYANTRYPNGFNFNRRPWITGHTYQNYGYDPHLKKMLFTGRPNYTYIYDVDRGDWGARFKKPDGMIYNSCFYTLTLCPTPEGLVCWTKNGELFQFDAKKRQWKQRETNGEKLPGAVVDNSTLTYDSKRQRLYFFVKPYGKPRIYDGQIYMCDLRTGKVSRLSPAGMEAASAIPYLCQIRYDEGNDLLLVGGTLPPGEDGLRRTPAYDPAGNRWVSLKITGDDPSGPRGRNVSLGLMYDAKRKMFWAVDTNSQVYALKVARDVADVRELK